MECVLEQHVIQVIFLSMLAGALPMLYSQRQRSLLDDTVHVQLLEETYSLHHNRGRVSRSVDAMPDSLHFRILFGSRDLHLRMKRNSPDLGKDEKTDLLGFPVFVIENGRIKQKKMQHDSGIGLYSNQSTGSSFIVRKTNNLTNFTLDGTFFDGLDHLSLASDPNGGPHQIHKESRVVDFRGDYYINSLHAEDPRKDSTERLSAVNEARDNARSKRELGTTSENEVQLFMIADNKDYRTWLKYYKYNSTLTELEMNLYYAFVANSMNVRYGSIQNVDISFTLKIIITGLLIVNSPEISSMTENNVDPETLTVDATRTLESFRVWIKSAVGLPQSDHWMLFTGFDISTEGNPNVAGLAKLGGMCTPNSISLIEQDNTGSVGATAAHELGHSLGAMHDGEEAGCFDEDNYIMSSKLKTPDGELLASRPWQFSTCSVRAFKKFVSGSKCTHKSVRGLSVLSTSLHPGQVFSADLQCQLALGNGSFFARSLQQISSYPSMCRRMWCAMPDLAPGHFQGIFALERTSCGNGKWCQRGKCVFHAAAPKVEDNCPQGDHPTAPCDAEHCPYYSNHTKTVYCCRTCRSVEPREESVSPEAVVIRQLSASPVGQRLTRRPHRHGTTQHNQTKSPDYQDHPERQHNSSKKQNVTEEPQAFSPSTSTVWPVTTEGAATTHAPNRQPGESYSLDFTIASQSGSSSTFDYTSTSDPVYFNPIFKYFSTKIPDISHINPEFLSTKIPDISHINPDYLSTKIPENSHINPEFLSTKIPDISHINPEFLPTKTQDISHKNPAFLSTKIPENSNINPEFLPTKIQDISHKNPELLPTKIPENSNINPEYIFITNSTIHSPTKTKPIYSTTASHDSLKELTTSTLPAQTNIPPSQTDVIPSQMNFMPINSSPGTKNSTQDSTPLATTSSTTEFLISLVKSTSENAMPSVLSTNSMPSVLSTPKNSMPSVLSTSEYSTTKESTMRTSVYDQSTNQSKTFNFNKSLNTVTNDHDRADSPVIETSEKPTVPTSKKAASFESTTHSLLDVSRGLSSTANEITTTLTTHKPRMTTQGASTVFKSEKRHHSVLSPQEVVRNAGRESMSAESATSDESGLMPNPGVLLLILQSQSDSSWNFRYRVQDKDSLTKTFMQYHRMEDDRINHENLFNRAGRTNNNLTYNPVWASTKYTHPPVKQTTEHLRSDNSSYNIHGSNDVFQALLNNTFLQNNTQEKNSDIFGLENNNNDEWNKLNLGIHIQSSSTAHAALLNDTFLQNNTHDQNLDMFGLDTNNIELNKFHPGTSVASSSSAPVAPSAIRTYPGESFLSSIFASLLKAGSQPENKTSFNNHLVSDDLAKVVAQTASSGTSSSKESAQYPGELFPVSSVVPAPSTDQLSTASPQFNQDQPPESDQSSLPTPSTTVMTSTDLKTNGLSVFSPGSSQSVTTQEGNDQKAGNGIATQQPQNINHLYFSHPVETYPHNAVSTEQRRELPENENNFFIQTVNNGQEITRFQKQPLPSEVIIQNFNRIYNPSVSSNSAILGTGLEIVPESLQALGIAPVPNVNGNINPTNPIGVNPLTDIASIYASPSSQNIPPHRTSNPVMDFVLQRNIARVNHMSNSIIPHIGSPSMFNMMNAFNNGIDRTLINPGSRTILKTLEQVNKNPAAKAILNSSAASGPSLSAPQQPLTLLSTFLSLFPLSPTPQANRRTPKCRFPCVFYMQPPVTNLFNDYSIFYQKPQLIQPTSSATLSDILSRAMVNPGVEA